MQPLYSSALALTLCAATYAAAPYVAAANPSADLEAALVGLQVVVEIDLPATKDGVDLRVDDRPQAIGRIDSDSYADRLRTHGTAIAAGQIQVITKVKVKGRHIEFHLGGGGYGTFFDETPSVDVPHLAKSRYERQLETELESCDEGDRRDVRRRLERARRERKREQARLEIDAQAIAEAQRARIADQALSAGSRFNLRFEHDVPAWALTPQGIVQILDGLVAFEQGEPLTREPLTRNERPAGLTKGMSLSEVEQVLGAPTAEQISEQSGLIVRVGRFPAADGELEAVFVEDVLVRVHTF